VMPDDSPVSPEIEAGNIGGVVSYTRSRSAKQENYRNLIRNVRKLLTAAAGTGYVNNGKLRLLIDAYDPPPAKPPPAKRIRPPGSRRKKKVRAYKPGVQYGPKIMVPHPSQTTVMVAPEPAPTILWELPEPKQPFRTFVGSIKLG
jgi:hypothetical protein